MMTPDSNKSTGMTPKRLEALSDGIFAFAMTLLVLSINMPLAGQVMDVSGFLLAQINNFWNFSLIFFLLAVFWLDHSQQFHHIKKTTPLTIWINLLVLLFVVLMPFSTSLMNDFPTNMIAEVFFNLNMFVLSALLSFNWWYSCKAGLIDPDSDPKHIARASEKGLLMPILALFALLVAFIYPGWSTLVYLLVPVALFWPAKKRS